MFNTIYKNILYVYCAIYYVTEVFLSGFQVFFTLNLGRKHNFCLSLEQPLRVYDALKYCLGRERTRLWNFPDIITTQDDSWDISHKGFFDCSA